MLDPSLSLVLPAYNEAENIEIVVGRALKVLPQLLSTIEVIVVNDGSTDGTGQIIDELAEAHPEVVAVHHKRNQGYGGALRSGFAQASGDLIMFMDADRQFDIADISALLPYVPHYDIVAGYRIKRRDALYRKVFAEIFDMSVWLLFGIHMRDVDCAFKIYRADLVKKMPLEMPGALINTEMLAFARRMGASIVEVGVHHYPRMAGEPSGGSPRVVIRAMGETVRLWSRLRGINLPEYQGAQDPPLGWSRVPGALIAGATSAAVLSLMALLLLRRRD